MVLSYVPPSFQWWTGQWAVRNCFIPCWALPITGKGQLSWRGCSVLSRRVLQGAILSPPSQILDVKPGDQEGPRCGCHDPDVLSPCTEGSSGPRHDKQGAGRPCSSPFPLPCKPQIISLKLTTKSVTLFGHFAIPDSFLRVITKAQLSKYWSAATKSPLRLP